MVAICATTNIDQQRLRQHLNQCRGEETTKHGALSFLQRKADDVPHLLLQGVYLSMCAFLISRSVVIQGAGGQPRAEPACYRAGARVLAEVEQCSR